MENTNTDTWEDENVKPEKINEFEQKLKDAFCDECNGVIEYNNLAKEAAEKYPNSGYAQLFKDIAKEEHLHKNHIKSILIDMGVAIDNSMCKLEGSAEESRQKF